MSDETTPETAPDTRKLQRGVLAVAAVATLFWIYTFFHIARVANPRGDGMEFLAAVPMTTIFLFLVLPPLVVAPFLRRYPTALKIVALVLALGVILDVLIWWQILIEFAGKGR